MLRSLLLLVLTVLSCYFFACKKDPPKLPTIVKGTVVDSKTGEPIAGATVEFYNVLLKNNGNSITNVAETTLTDTLGNFIYTVRSDAESVYIYRIYAGNYVTKRADNSVFAINMGTTNELSIPLIRYNAAIRLHIMNETDTDNAVYIVVSNPTKLAEARTSWGVIKFSPLIIGQGQQQNYVYPTIANEYTTFYWGGNNFYPYNTAPFSDSLYFNIGDTLDYTIQF